MQRTLLIAALIALAAAPAAAQGKSKAHHGQSEFRTNDDHRGTSRSDDDRDDDDRDDDDRDDDDRDEKRASRGRRDNYGSESQRVYIDSRGLECREKNKVKKDGRRSSETRCKEPKHRKNDRSARDSRNTPCTPMRDPRTTARARRSRSRRSTPCSSFPRASASRAAPRSRPGMPSYKAAVLPRTTCR